MECHVTEPARDTTSKRHGKRDGPDPFSDHVVRPLIRMDGVHITQVSSSDWRRAVYCGFDSLRQVVAAHFHNRRNCPDTQRLFYQPELVADHK